MGVDAWARAAVGRDAVTSYTTTVRRGAQILVVLLLASGCASSDDSPQGAEIDRTPSPDGQLDAVLMSGGGDATTGVIHDVFIVPHGARLPRRRSERVAVFEWAYRNSSTTGLTLRWHGRDTLALEYLRATPARLPARRARAKRARARHTRQWRIRHLDCSAKGTPASQIAPSRHAAPDTLLQATHHARHAHVAESAPALPTM